MNKPRSLCKVLQSRKKPKHAITIPCNVRLFWTRFLEKMCITISKTYIWSLIVQNRFKNLLACLNNQQILLNTWIRHSKLHTIGAIRLIHCLRLLLLTLGFIPLPWRISPFMYGNILDNRRIQQHGSEKAYWEPSHLETTGEDFYGIKSLRTEAWD